MSFDGTPADRARDLLARTEDFEELGLGKFAAAARVVADDCLRLVDELAAERSARQTIQATAVRCIRILADQAGRACLLDAFRKVAAAAVDAEADDLFGAAVEDEDEAKRVA